MQNINQRITPKIEASIRVSELSKSNVPPPQLKSDSASMLSQIIQSEKKDKTQSLGQIISELPITKNQFQTQFMLKKL